VLPVVLLALAFSFSCGASDTNVSITIQYATALRGRAFWPIDTDWQGHTLFCTTVVDNPGGKDLWSWAPYRTVFDSLYVAAFDENGKCFASAFYHNSGTPG